MFGNNEPQVPAQMSQDGPLELRLSSKILSIHNKIDILDANDEVVYRVHSKAIAINDRTFIEDAQGNEVANIHAKIMSIHDIYYVEMANGLSFELSRELLHLNDYIDIEALGWQLRSKNILEFQFDIVDTQGNEIAHASRKLITLHDTYTVEVYDRAHADEVMAIFVVMKHIMEQRAASEDATSEKIIHDTQQGR